QLRLRRKRRAAARTGWLLCEGDLGGAADGDVEAARVGGGEGGVGCVEGVAGAGLVDLAAGEGEDAARLAAGAAGEGAAARIRPDRERERGGVAGDGVAAGVLDGQLRLGGE